MVAGGSEATKKKPETPPPPAGWYSTLMPVSLVASARIASFSSGSEAAPSRLSSGRKLSAIKWPWARALSSNSARFSASACRNSE